MKDDAYDKSIRSAASVFVPGPAIRAGFPGPRLDQAIERNRVALEEARLLGDSDFCTLLTASVLSGASYRNMRDKYVAHGGKLPLTLVTSPASDIALKRAVEEVLPGFDQACPGTTWEDSASRVVKPKRWKSLTTGCLIVHISHFRHMLPIIDGMVLWAYRIEPVTELEFVVDTIYEVK